MGKIKEFFGQLNNLLMAGFTALIFMCYQLIQGIWGYKINVPIFIVYILLLVFYLVVIAVIALLRFERKKSKNDDLPRVVSYVVQEERIIFMIEDSDLYSVDMFMSIYHTDSSSGFESFICVGLIETKNGNGFYQVKTQKVPENQITKDFIRKIVRKEIPFGCIKIRPGITRVGYELIKEKENE